MPSSFAFGRHIFSFRLGQVFIWQPAFFSFVLLPILVISKSLAPYFPLCAKEVSCSFFKKSILRTKTLAESKIVPPHAVPTSKQLNKCISQVNKCAYLRECTDWMSNWTKIARLNKSKEDLNVISLYVAVSYVQFKKKCLYSAPLSAPFWEQKFCFTRWSVIKLLLTFFLDQDGTSGLQISNVQRFSNFCS